jgi:predicted thioesterase
MSLEQGMERTTEFVAEGALLTDAGGTLPRQVLSTPGMIGMMEHTAAQLVYPHLEPGHATVGFEVCVRHVAAAPAGAACSAHVRLREVVDARKLRFDVEVTSDGRTIGVGTHERRVISAL